jgi:hypothetical protein
MAHSSCQQVKHGKANAAAQLPQVPPVRFVVLASFFKQIGLHPNFVTDRIQKAVCS